MVVSQGHPDGEQRQLDRSRFAGPPTLCPLNVPSLPGVRPPSFCRRVLKRPLLCQGPVFTSSEFSEGVKPSHRTFERAAEGSRFLLGEMVGVTVYNRSDLWMEIWEVETY